MKAQTEIAIGGGGMNSPIVEQCVRSIIESIQFPEPPEGTVVEVTGFPFIFSGMK